jgi:Tfp pilus assembly ATPase PilU
MQLMDDTLIDLFGRDLITVDEALARAEQKEMVRQNLGKR